MSDSNTQPEDQTLEPGPPKNSGVEDDSLGGEESDSPLVYQENPTRTCGSRPYGRKVMLRGIADQDQQRSK